MEKFEDHKIDLLFEAIEVEEDKVYFIGEALTQDYECEEGLTSLSKKLINKDFTWRHRHPLQKEHKENHVYGVVRDSWVKDKLMVKVQMYDHTEDHRKYIEDIKLRDFVKEPLSLSMHYRTYFNEEGEKVHYDVFELAGTPYPHCKKCQILKTGVMKMEKDEKVEPEKTETKEEEAELSKALTKIEELEKELNSKTKTLEDLKTKSEKLDKELEEKEKTLEERVLEFEAKIEFLENKKPILDKLLEADSDIDEKQVAWLKTESVDYLNKRLEEAQKRAESQIVVKELEETAEEVQAEGEEERQKIEDVSYEQFISQIKKTDNGRKTK
jgi:DNA repair exonuclease SbcCD ATPase subunit